MLILPIGNENSTVQRLPWVTFTIIGLNIAIFCLTLPGVLRSENELEASGKAIQEYLASKPYLITDENLQKMAEAGIIQKSQTEAVKESLGEYQDAMQAARTRISTMQRDIEQQRLDSMLDEFGAAYRTRPYYRFGVVPADRRVSSFISSMFMHGGLLHLFGNLLFFFAVGFSLEDIWGRFFFASFYLIGGIAASVTHVFIYPTSTVPCIGASGAIAAVMGAFLVRFFRSKIKMFYWFFPAAYFGARPWGTFNIAAYIFLPFWFAEQVLDAWASRGGDGSGVGVWAHIGGFAFGVVFAFALKGLKVEERILKPAIDAKVEFGAVGLVRDALAALDRGATDEAERLLMKHLSENPKDVSATLALIQTCEQAGNEEKARSARSRLVQQYIDVGDKESALFAYDNLLGSFGSEKPCLSLSARHWMAVCDYLVEREMFQEAAMEYRRLASRYPDQPFAVKALINSGDLLLDKVQSPKEALASYQQGLSLNPTHIAWLNRLQEGKTRASAMVLPTRAGAPPKPPAPIPAPAAFPDPNRPVSSPS